MSWARTLAVSKNKSTTASPALPAPMVQPSGDRVERPPRRMSCAVSFTTHKTPGLLQSAQCTLFKHDCKGILAITNSYKKLTAACTNGSRAPISTCPDPGPGRPTSIDARGMTWPALRAVVRGKQTRERLAMCCTPAQIRTPDRWRLRHWDRASPASTVTPCRHAIRTCRKAVCAVCAGACADAAQAASRRPRRCRRIPSGRVGCIPTRGAPRRSVRS